jgi:hypothetical protein
MSTMAEPQRMQTAHLCMLIQRSPCSCSCAAEPLTTDARSRMRGVCSRCAPQAPLSCLLRRRARRMRHGSAPHVIYVSSACVAACSARMCLCRRSPWREAYFQGSLVRDPDMLPASASSCLGARGRACELPCARQPARAAASGLRAIPTPVLARSTSSKMGSSLAPIDRARRA